MYNPSIKLVLILSILQLSIIHSFAQPLGKKIEYTHADTLRGSNGPGRIHWDVLHYEITVQPDYTAKTIEGKNIITYKDNGVSTMQIDLQQPMIMSGTDDCCLSFLIDAVKDIQYLLPGH